VTTSALVPCIVLALGLALAVAVPRGGRCIALLAAAAALTFFALRYTVVPEDSFISMRYSRHLAEGHGLVYNVGERVEGYTNFLWTLLLAGVHAVGLPPLETAVALSIASGVAVLFVMTRALPRLLGRPDALSFGVPALALLPAFWDAAGTGLETSFYAFWVTLAAVEHAVAIREERAPGLVAFVALAAAALTRPEGVYVAGLLAVSSIFVRRTDRAFVRAEVKLLAAVGGVVLVHLLWRRWYYGEWLPNTFYCKVGATMEQVKRGVDQLFWFLRWDCALLLVPCAAAPWLLRRAPWLAPPLAVGVGYVAYVVFIGGDNFWKHRYLAPVVPCLLLVSELTVRECVSLTALPKAAFVALAAAFPVAVWAQADGHKLKPATQGVDGARFPLSRAFGKWLEGETPKDGSIAVEAAGVIPYYTDRTIVDMYGLNDHHIARVKPRAAMGRHNAGHEKYDYDYVLSRAPEFILMEFPDPPNDDSPLGRAMLADPTLKPRYMEKYEVFQQDVQGRVWTGLRRKR
jgi:arabinofuranosyltransferase